MKTSALFFALAFGLPSFSPAQIFVGSGGLPAPLTFDSAPALLAVEWATTTNGIPGGGGTFSTTGDVATAVQALHQNIINEPLQRITFNSTFEAARHNTVDNKLVTQSTSVGATVLKATLRNTHSQAFSHVTVSYHFGLDGVVANETAPGHLVFFSTNGLPGSWRLIPAFSALTTNSVVNAALFVGRWLPNTDLYLLWADDNSDSASPENTNSLDNFFVSSPVVTNVSLPLSITLTAPAHETVAFNPVTVSATAAGSTAVTGVSFYVNNVLVATDTTAPYSVGVSAFSPTNTFYARAFNTTGSVTSVTNTVRVRDEFEDYTGGTYTQTFDGMGASGTETPPGWYAGITLPAQTVDVTPGDGTSLPQASVIGWNHGTTGSGDRAFGTSPTAGERNMVLRLRNSSGQPLTGFTLRYDGEVWRNYTLPQNGWLTNYYSTNQGTNWIPTSFNFIQPFASVPPQTNYDGNLPGNRTADIGGTIYPATPVLPGSVLYFRWHDFNETNSDGALALDNVSFTGLTPPTNDTCAGAIALSNGVTYFQNTLSATGDLVSGCNGVSNGVWFTFTPDFSGNIEISTCGSDFDTRMVVHQGACASPTSQICNEGFDSPCFNRAYTNLTFVNGGTTYRILVGGVSGGGNLAVTATLCPFPRLIGITSSSVNIPNGIRVTYEAQFTDLPFDYDWSFNVGNPINNAGSIVTRDFGIFDTFPTSVTVNVRNICGPNSGMGNPTPPCGAICLSINSTATHTTTDGGSAASPVPATCGELDSQYTTWFPLGANQSAAGMAFLSISNSSPDTVISVYRGDILSSLLLVEVGCATNGGNSRVARFETRPGTNYYVAARTLSPSTLNIRHGYDLVPPAPGNDLCANAILMSPGVPYSNNTLNATSTDPVPLTACVPSFGRGIWYSYFATATGPVLLSTCDSDFDTALQVYSGTCAALVPVAGSCTNNNGPLCAGTRASLRFNAVQNTTYRILVGGANQAAGNLVISATPCAAPVFSALTTSVTLESNGVRVLYQAAFSNNAPHTYRWAFSDGVTNLTTSNSLSRLFGPFHPHPASVTVSATNFCGSNSSTINLPPPCEPICLASALDTNRTHLGTIGSGTNGVSYNNSGGIFPAVGTRWFRLWPLTNGAGVAFISSAGSAPDTRLAVYRTNSFASNALAFETNRSVGGAPSRVEFETRAGTNYWLAVHTTNGGALQLTYGYQVRFASVALTNVNGNRALDLLSMPLPSRQYRLRGGTNLAVPLSSWSNLLTTNFSNSISVNTNILRFRDTNVPVLNQRFYQIERVP